MVSSPTTTAPPPSTEQGAGSSSQQSVSRERNAARDARPAHPHPHPHDMPRDGPDDVTRGRGRGRLRGGGGVWRWVRAWWRALVAELVATALLVWLGVASAMPVPSPVPVAHPAWAFGLVVLANAMAFGPVSGAHMNPAVSLAAALAGRLPWAAAAGYAGAQLAGGVVGAGALLASHAPPSPAGCTLPALPPLAAAALEAAITGTLALAACAAWAAHDDARPDHTTPIKIGLVVTGLIFVAGPATGASLNPARSFGPALLHGYWTHHWVYWVGPLAGAALASILHRHLLSPPTPATSTPRLPEELPLDKP